jgi:3-deoxy-manno-octulosonate cytidylyltransferase (CMP-KDO synthetase)
MVVRVFERARRCSALARVVLATDDHRIADAAKAWKVPVVMTRTDHPSGTDRVLEAAESLGVPENAAVVNIQGDEPAIDPSMLDEVIGPFRNRLVQVATLAAPMDAADGDDPNQVKVVMSQSGRALYFSRSVIPFFRDGKPSGYHRHIGLDAFRMAALRRFAAIGPGRLESIEKLEQLRFLEHDIPIQVVVTEHTSMGVDRPEDIATVSRIIRQQERDWVL